MHEAITITHDVAGKTLFPPSPIGISCEHDEGFIDFNKWKIEYINQDMQIDYSASNKSIRLTIIMDTITEMNLSNNCKIFRVLNDNKSIVMNELDIRKSLRLLFKF